MVYTLLTIYSTCLPLLRGGWSEPVTTNAPVQDEAIQAVLGMNQKHILPCLRFLVFFASYLPQKFSFLPTYLTSFCAHSIARDQESLKWEGRRGRAKVAIRTKHLKWKGRSGSLKVSSFPSLHFFFLCILSSSLCFRRRW